MPAPRRQITVETRFQFADEQVTTLNTLRFSNATAIMASCEAGFTAHAVYGNWHGEPLEDTSPEIIVLAQASLG